MLPKAFTERIEQQIDDSNVFFKTLDQSLITSIRYNPNKLHDYLKGKPIPWCSKGIYLKERPKFTYDPLFHAGTYYVQDASSMFLEQIIHQLPLANNSIVLDICAAPGGKSTHLSAIIDRTSLIISNEIIAKRNAILVENIIKWGNSNSIVTQNKPQDFEQLPQLFDLVLIDAPCSGEGLFRKDQKAINEWSEQHVASCALRQEKIIGSIIPSLKQGGYLIYSTCTYSYEENEKQIEKMLASNLFEMVSIKCNPEWGVETSELGFRFYPHKLDGEGFFISCLRKKGNSIDQDSKFSRKIKTSNSKNAPTYLSKSISSNISKYIDVSNKMLVQTKNNDLYAIDKDRKDVFDLLYKQLNIRYAGTRIGKLVRDKLIPAHALALSKIMLDTVPHIEINKEQALQYLKKSTLKLDMNSKGWHLLKYKSHNLGWINHLGHRINNYYPNDWRIKR